MVVDSDTAASFRARGVELDSPGALGSLLRERPLEVLDHYRAEVRSRVDVLAALTGDTTPARAGRSGHAASGSAAHGPRRGARAGSCGRKRKAGRGWRAYWARTW